jgi:hypothetical protein
MVSVPVRLCFPLNCWNGMRLRMRLPFRKGTTVRLAADTPLERPGTVPVTTVQDPLEQHLGCTAIVCLSEELSVHGALA